MYRLQQKQTHDRVTSHTVDEYASETRVYARDGGQMIVPEYRHFGPPFW